MLIGDVTIYDVIIFFYIAINRTAFNKTLRILIRRGRPLHNNAAAVE